MVAPFSFAAHVAPLNLARLKYGLPPIDWDIKQVYSFGDYTLYPDIPELIPTTQLPSHHHFIGPILWSPVTPSPDWWEQLPEDKPLVYVNLGSSGQRKLLPIVLTALSQLPVTVMAATASEMQLGEVPANAYVSKYLPGTEAARRSRLVICNGGNMSTQQALAAAAPVLAIVSNLDQMLFARAVSEAGAGEVLKDDEVTVASVKKSVWKILKWSGYGAAAERIRLLYEQRQATLLFPGFMASLPARKVESRSAR
jgi:UDP:flavonoid glycosyltransferase YjiC (YdhE family)